jgi:hypothetical protein
MGDPFSIYNFRSSEDVVVRPKRIRENTTVLDRTSDVLNRLQSLRELGLFSDATLDWVRGNAPLLRGLNVYMMCWTYELIQNITTTATMRGEDVDEDVYSDGNIIHELRRDQYERFREYLIKGKKIDQGAFISASETEIIVYSKFIFETISR